ncbi:heavy metal sensor histidine kinase (plasmid) [Comamonadaceae bacterium OTU4NAUVB1]|nr:heavy metal sensor histidine kinase [Comamonadaceae bacterium OTU4NAUVB1]
MTSTPTSIQASLSRWFALQTFVGLSAICVVIYALTAWSFQLKQQDEFERHVELVVHLLNEPRSDSQQLAFQHKLDDFFRSHNDIGIVLYAGGQTVYESKPAESSTRWRWTSTDLRDKAPQLGTDPKLWLGVDVREDEKLLHRLGLTLLGMAVLGSMLVSLTGVLLVRRGLRPLQQLATQLATTGPEFADRRIDPGTYALELVPWINQFNAVLGRAEQAYQQLEAFNADVAHELRTPLANMIAEVEVELARPRTPEALQDALISNLEETRRLSAIVTDMLFLSKADRGATARRSEPVSLAAQALAVVEFHEAELEQTALQVQVHGDAMVRIDVSLVRRALSNLLSNAVRYATPATTIEIRIEAVADSVWLRVINPGLEIPVDALPHLFKRFFRAERSRSRSSAHHGLGLAIVAAIARMHGGATLARSANGRTEISFSVRHASAQELEPRPS